MHSNVPSPPSHVQHRIQSNISKDCFASTVFKSPPRVRYSLCNRGERRREHRGGMRTTGASMHEPGKRLWDFFHERVCQKGGETVILLHPPLFLAGVSIGMDI